MNDGFFGDTGPQSSRRLFWPGGEQEFRGYLAGSTDDDIVCQVPGPGWVNVDDRMGFVFAGTGSPVYVNKHYHEVFHAVYDELILGQHEPGRGFRSGEKVAELAVLWRPDQDHEATRTQSLEILDTPDGIFAGRVDDWLCACNFTESACELPDVVLEPMEPQLRRAAS
jgi:hypothetical protein